MKRLQVLLAVLLIAAFGVCALGSGESTTTTGAAANQEVEQAVEQTQEDGDLGKYNVKIDSCRLAKDYEGKPVVIVKYIYTNVSNDTATAFYIAFEDTVFQNGVGLNETIFVADSANYDSGNQTKEIKKGATIEVEVAYDLNDTTTNIEVEVKEFFSFSDDMITKTFSIS